MERRREKAEMAPMEQILKSHRGKGTNQTQVVIVRIHGIPLMRQKATHEWGTLADRAIGGNASLWSRVQPLRHTPSQGFETRS